MSPTGIASVELLKMQMPRSHPRPTDQIMQCRGQARHLYFLKALAILRHSPFPGQQAFGTHGTVARIVGRWFLAIGGAELAFEEWAGTGEGMFQSKGYREDSLQKTRWQE